jgi:hypothetical protein
LAIIAAPSTHNRNGLNMIYDATACCRARNDADAPFVLIVLALFIVLQGCDERVPRLGHGGSTALVDDLIGVLESCPAWSALDRDDIAGRRRVLECLRPFQRADTALVRQVLQQFESKHRDDPSDEVFKLFVLNRYLFNVPPRVSAGDAKFFDAWRVTRYDGKGGADLLWPLSIDESGRLVLTAAAGGYSGPPYRALAEFDYFCQRFGRRPPDTEPYVR